MKRTARMNSVVLSVLISVVGASVANACSMVPVTIQRWSKSTISFIGAAHNDTVRAGPGDIDFVVAGGHFGPAGNRTIYGQRVSVERLPTYATGKLPAGVREVVLIPWDYDASCRPTPWTRSARWIEPSARGIFTATLRDRQHWVNGVPTLDVMSPSGIPYRGVTSHPSDTATLLRIDELFAVASILPDPETMRTDPEMAAKPFLEWAEKHQEISSRRPASELVWNAVYTLSSTRMRNTKPDVSGTWRFTVEIPGDATRSFYARTEERPTSDWPLTATPASRKAWEIPELGGIYLLTSVDKALDKLPTSCMSRGKEGYMAQRLPSFTRANAPGTIAGELETSLMTQGFADDVAFKQYKFSRPPGVPQLTGMEAALDARAAFTTDSTGILRVVEEYAIQDGRQVMLRGERISNTVIMCEFR